MNTILNEALESLLERLNQCQRQIAANSRDIDDAYKEIERKKRESLELQREIHELQEAADKLRPIL